MNIKSKLKSIPTWALSALRISGLSISCMAIFLVIVILGIEMRLYLYDKVYKSHVKNTIYEVLINEKLINDKGSK